MLPGPRKHVTGKIPDGTNILRVDKAEDETPHDIQSCEMQLWKVRSFRNWGDEMSHSVLHNVIRSKRKTREPSKKTNLFSSSKSKHYQQSVLPTQANVNCMCSSIRRISKHFPSRQRPHCGTSRLNSRTQKHLYLTSCSEVVVQVYRTGRTQQQHKQIMRSGI